MSLGNGTTNPYSWHSPPAQQALMQSISKIERSVGRNMRRTLRMFYAILQVKGMLTVIQEAEDNRVQNNRKVNAGKKTWLDKGRQASHGDGTQSGRQGTVASQDDDGSLEGLGDEDAEGELDDDYQYAQQPTAGQNQCDLPKENTAYGQLLAASRRPKHELHSDESDYAGPRAKKSKRTSRVQAAPVKTARKKTGPPGSRSKYQAINGIIVDLEDRKYESMIYDHGSPDMKARFDAFHYPAGRSENDAGLFQANGSRRTSSRAAAPTHFLGVDNSDEGYNEDSGSQYEGTNGDGHQGARR
ncbi:MAG: hypothetical protein Q9170_005730 [Blastenia crenularia]